MNYYYIIRPIYHTLVLLPHYNTNLPYYLPHTCTLTTLSDEFTTYLYYYHISTLMYHTIYHTLVLLTHYQTNLPSYLPHTCTITTLSDLFTILFTTHLYYYHIIRLIYHTIYHTLVILPHYQSNISYYLPYI